MKFLNLYPEEAEVVNAIRECFRQCASLTWSFAYWPRTFLQAPVSDAAIRYASVLDAEVQQRAVEYTHMTKFPQLMVRLLFDRSMRHLSRFAPPPLLHGMASPYADASKEHCVGRNATLPGPVPASSCSSGRARGVLSRSRARPSSGKLTFYLCPPVIYTILIRCSLPRPHPFKMVRYLFC